MTTIAEAITEGSERLERGAVPEPRRTAGLLMGYLLGADRAQLLARSLDEIDTATIESFIELVERRAAGEPLQYITGHQEFYGLDFKVSRAVLIPRPETEFLVERVIALARDPQAGHENKPLIIDVGTGSGCIAVSLAAHIRGARLIAIDISPQALDIARLNAERHAVASRIEFLEGDWLSPLAGRGLEGAVDFLVSNPPYVPARDIRTLQREVRDWEPQEALFGGEQGLDFYSRLLGDGRNYLRPGGRLVCEIGYSQLEAVGEMIDPAAWKLDDVTSDLQGIPRTLTISRL
ncbi:MAG TPA: peptide chain release factor N(5)-glutamine methyltransferase [Blastocatellia bacterium]|nr:peptide chain release factor N(5)-glutamine methyltransferase [Blastocatellia bacterium]